MAYVKMEESKDEVPTIPELKERQLIMKIPRKDLEDRYLRLKDEQIDLKKKSHSQEAKMKQMATKLLRLVKDRKKLEEGGLAPDPELRDRIDELNVTVQSLEKQNKQLQSKLMVAKQQLSTHGKKPSQYSTIKSRINTGLPGKNKYQRIKEQIRVQSPMSPQKDTTRGTPPPALPLPQPRYGHSLLEEKRIEKQELETIVSNLQEQIQQYEEQTDLLQQQMRQREIDHEEDMQKLRQRFSGTQRSAIQENVELIKLQREVKEKANQLESLQGKYETLDKVMNKVKTSHGQVLEEIDRLNAKLKEEQVRNGNLQNELKHGNISQQTIAQREEQITDLKAEIQMLQEAHEKLLHSTFDVEKDREYRAKEKQYQLRIAQLEATIKSDVHEKNEVLDRLTNERDTTDNSKKQLQELQVKYYATKEKYDDLAEKLKFFTNESAVDFDEIQEALLLIKTRKEKASQDLKFLETVDENISRDLQKELQELQAAYADTINELEKTRSMLVIQHNINKDYQKEVEKTTKKMEELKKDCDLRVQEYSQLLDVRAERIKEKGTSQDVNVKNQKLESQLRDVAYGTRQFKIPADDEIVDTEEDLTVKLERGQNIFEIHIGKEKETSQDFGIKNQATLIKENLTGFTDDVEFNTFISYEFFEYELQATPVAQGISVDYNHTSQYTVQVDDFFLHYLQKEAMIFEFHHAYGTEYNTIAKANIKFNELLDRSHGRLHGTVTLIDCESSKKIVTVDYWIRLLVPMEQALRLYKERTKALGYITSNDLDSLDKVNEKSLKESGINELQIKILQCYQLKSTMKDVQPSAYCIYKFFDFPDHDTIIVKNSSSPQFHDTRVYPVPMTDELDNYLKNTVIVTQTGKGVIFIDVGVKIQLLQIYVFDDFDNEPGTYLGIAQIPLVTLTQNKPLGGKFQLINPSGEENGVISLSLEWKYTYFPASVKKVRTYPKPVDTTVYHDDVYSSTNHSTMQPIQTSGKLFEPTLTKPLSQTYDQDEMLEPMYDRNVTGKQQQKQQQQNVVEKSQQQQQLKVVKKPPQPQSGSTTNSKTVKQKKQRGRDFSSRTESEGSELMFEEELRRTYDKQDSEIHKASDTIFEEEQVSEETDEDLMMPSSARVTSSRNEFQDGDEEAEAGSEDTTEEDVIVASSLNGKPRKSSLAHQASTSIVVIIHSLTIFPDTQVLQVDSIRQLFVSYKFLDFDPEELETPMSLPKPKANRPISYNFKKVFHIDEEEHETSRQHLMHLLMPDHPNEGRIFFTVVSDPSDNEDEDCEDVGIAYVDLIQVLKEGKDLLEQDIDIFDLLGSDGDVMGTLTVTVEAIAALRGLYE